MTLDFNYFQSLIVEYGLNIIWAIVIIVVGWWLAGILSKLLRKNMNRADIDPSVIGFAGNMVYWAILIFAILGALARVGVQTTSIIAVLGAASLAVGLALQGSLSNFAAGVLILLFRPYRIGDYVEIAGAAGTVKEIQIFNTVMETPDQKVVFVPNAQATGGNITNYTTKGTRRVDMVFGIGYDDDVLKAKSLLEQIITADERVFADPAPVVAVLELADSSVNFAVRPFVKVEDYWPVLFDTTEKVKLEFDKAGISIPFPQQDVHLFSESN
jgi:small conductance mechanosensitive channel